MQCSKYPVIDQDSLSLVYSGLGSISDKGRKHLKNVAQSLIALQNRPGVPLPDRISREITGHNQWSPEFGERQLLCIE